MTLLLDIAESSILNYMDGDLNVPVNMDNINEEVSIEAGAFVSVYVKDKLRGCIGSFSESEALYLVVRKMAVSAAFHDSRFTPLNRSEAEDLSIEISVLTPRKRIYNEQDIEIGKHGIYMISDFSRGTLLPQVAVKNNWSRTEFLEQCAQNKLGMDKRAWRTAELYTYEAIVFKR